MVSIAIKGLIVSMKRKMLYITTDSWWDTDVSILPDLAKNYKLEVYCSSGKNKKTNKYPEKSVPANVVFHNKYFIRSKKDIRMFFSSIFYGLKLLFASIGKTTIWVFDGNPYNAWFLIALLSKKRTIISLHNYAVHIDARSWQKLIHRFMLKKFRLFHFHSPMQEALFKKDYPNKKSFSTMMPVKYFGQPNKHDSFFDNNKRTYLFFGGIREYKRPDLFIEAANALKDKANFIIAGYNKNWTKYKAMVDADNSMLCFFRFIDNEEIPDFFCNVDFLVLPYDDSTQSGPLLIAYNYNLPIIASSLPYFEDMIDNGKSGFIFNKGNLNALVEVLNKSIDMNENDYKAMKEAMSLKVEKYKHASSYIDLFHKFMKGNNL